jgi:hypothetical protein
VSPKASPLGLVVWFEDEPCRVEAAAAPIGWMLQPLREGLPRFRALRRTDGTWLAVERQHARVPRWSVGGVR